MLFMAWSDTGDQIKAYCVPDSYSGYSKLELYIDEKLHCVLEPTEFNQYIGGRHETGNVGFVIDNQTVANLQDIVNLELRDMESQLLVYRRRPHHPLIDKCILRLETHIFPLWRIDEAMKKYFRFWYNMIDRHSSETVRQIFEFKTFDSIYSSGRIVLTNYEHHLKDISIFMMMQDPYMELAERLFIFNKLKEDSVKLLGERDAILLQPVIEFANSIEDFSEKRLKGALSRASRQVVSCLSDPVTRQLTASNPSETAGQSSFGKALKQLSDFAVVGLREESSMFIEDMASTIGIPPNIIPKPPLINEVQDIALKLRQIATAESLIEFDLALYQQVKYAFEQAQYPKD